MDDLLNEYEKKLSEFIEMKSMNKEQNDTDEIKEKYLELENQKEFIRNNDSNKIIKTIFRLKTLGLI